MKSRVEQFLALLLCFSLSTCSQDYNIRSGDSATQSPTKEEKKITAPTNEAEQKDAPANPENSEEPKVLLFADSIEGAPKLGLNLQDDEDFVNFMAVTIFGGGLLLLGGLAAKGALKKGVGAADNLKGAKNVADPTALKTAGNAVPSPAATKHTNEAIDKVENSWKSNNKFKRTDLTDGTSIFSYTSKQDSIDITHTKRIQADGSEGPWLTFFHKDFTEVDVRKLTWNKGDILVPPKIKTNTKPPPSGFKAQDVEIPNAHGIFEQHRVFVKD